MPNPILIFLNLSKFGKPDGWRKGVNPDGAIEDIVPNAQYSLILLGDQDSFASLAFQHDREEATLGVEHGSWPISGARKTALTAICGHYEHVYTFSHVDDNDIFKYMRTFFNAMDDARRKNTIAEIIAFIKTRDRWNGLVQFLMNQQIGLLGGKKLSFNELPRSAVEFMNKLEDDEASFTYKKIIDEFLASRSSD
jgi:hypothetical protein